MLNSYTILCTNVKTITVYNPPSSRKIDFQYGSFDIEWTVQNFLWNVLALAGFRLLLQILNLKRMESCDGP